MYGLSQIKVYQIACVSIIPNVWIFKWTIYFGSTRPFQGSASFVDPLCYFVLCLSCCHCLFMAALWSPAGKGLIYSLSCMWCFRVLMSLSLLCPGSGVVFLIFCLLPYFDSNTHYREHSGSVVKCLAQDWEAIGSSLTGVTVLCPWARHIYPCLVLVQPRKTRPDISEELLTGT